MTDESRDRAPVPTPSPHPAAQRVLSARLVVVAALVVVAVAVVSAWLLLAYFSGPADSARLDALRLSATFAFGTGGAFALWLAARRQRSMELGLQEQARIASELAADRAKDLLQREAVAADSRQDALERRITELYTKAADQLGNNKAPVRLAGLYALERLAQGSPDQRQTIANLICAYLRMPSPPSGVLEDESEDDFDVEAFRVAREEWQVRSTAQSILGLHLRCADPAAPPYSFWPDMMVELDGAHLYNMNLHGCRIKTGSFRGARFTGTTVLAKASIGGSPNFEGAQFDELRMHSATVDDGINFCRAVFRGKAVFTGSSIGVDAEFNFAVFESEAYFISVSIGAGLYFPRAQFRGRTDFKDLSVSEDLVFSRATLRGPLVLKAENLPPRTKLDGALVDPRALAGLDAIVRNRYAVVHQEDGLCRLESRSGS